MGRPREDLGAGQCGARRSTGGGSPRSVAAEGLRSLRKAREVRKGWRVGRGPAAARGCGDGRRVAGRPQLWHCSGPA